MHISVPVEGTVEIINFTQISPLVSKCQIKVLYVDDKPNRNGTVITKDIAEKIGQKLPGSPIVGYYNGDFQDFEEHNRELQYDKNKGEFGLVDTTKAYGFVPTDAKVWFQQFEDDDGATRLYLCTEGIIWTEAYPEAKRILEEGNNQSLEFNKQTLKGDWAGELNSNRRFFIVNEAIVEKLCVLGENFEPCFQGAQIKTTFSLADALEELRHSTYSMIQDMSTKGGLNLMEDNVTLAPEQEITAPATEFIKKDEEEKEKSQDNSEKETNSKSEDNTEKSKGNPSKEDDKDDEDKKKKYSLNEIPEYVGLMGKYQELQISYAALEKEKNSLVAEITPLRQFKLDKDRESKQEMIDSFYMLSDEDKKDVVQNIDTYSLNDIESKLSVICVRNKVSFAAPEDTSHNESQQLTYSLNAAVEQEVSDTPAWLKAVREIEKTMN